MMFVLGSIRIRVEVERNLPGEDHDHAERRYRQAEMDRRFRESKEEALRKAIMLGLRPW